MGHIEWDQGGPPAPGWVRIAALAVIALALALLARQCTRDVSTPPIGADMRDRNGEPIAAR